MPMRRKKLVMEGDKLRALANRLHVSESEAARRAVDLVLAGEEAAEALRGLRARGTLKDAYHRAPRR